MPQEVIQQVKDIFETHRVTLENGERISVSLNHLTKEMRQELVRLFGRKYMTDVIRKAISELSWTQSYQVRLKPNKHDPNIVSVTLKK